MPYVSGAWRAICDRCGKDYLNTQLRKEWTGLRTCHGAGTSGCWEARQPQDHVRGKPDRQAPPWVRPDPEPVYVEGNGISQDDL